MVIGTVGDPLIPDILHPPFRLVHNTTMVFGTSLVTSPCLTLSVMDINDDSIRVHLVVILIFELHKFEVLDVFLSYSISYLP